MRYFLAAIAILVVACAQPSSNDTEPPTVLLQPHPDVSDLSAGVPAQVTFVSDGDSFRAEVAGSDERVRMIGINAPERDECYGAEAGQILTELIDGREVLLVSDVEPNDQYGRLLAYVYVDGLLINAEMAARGAALARSYEPNTMMQAILDTAESRHRTRDAGCGPPTPVAATNNRTVVITEIQANPPGRDEENLNGEYVILENRSETSISLAGWTLRDESSVHRFVFPPSTSLEPGASLVVFTGCGQDEAALVYWCAGSPVWDNSGDSAFLLDLDGATRHRFAY